MTETAMLHTPFDGSFLTGSELSAAIRYVLGGDHRRCAVAFWGNNSDELFQYEASVSDLKLVCDISMGGCHPEALRSLGAPNDPNIKYHDGLHAKVYISDLGVIIGSANASNNGIGFGSKDAVLVEAATFHSPGAEAWVKAAVWFDALHSCARQVDETALERAKHLFRPCPVHRAAVAGRPGSLLDMVVVQPERFDSIGFVLSSIPANNDERVAARKDARRAGIDRSLIESTHDHDMFIGWDTEDVLRWPTSFIELWMPKDRLSLYARTTTAIDHKKGNVFTKKNKRALQKMVPVDLPDFREAERQDAKIVAKLLADGGKVFRTAADFAAAIEAVIA